MAAEVREPSSDATSIVLGDTVAPYSKSALQNVVVIKNSRVTGELQKSCTRSELNI